MTTQLSQKPAYTRLLEDALRILAEGAAPGPVYTKEKVLREGVFLNPQLLDLGLAVRM